MRQIHFDFLLFSIFESDFLLNVFPIPILVLSRPSFLFERIFPFSLVVFRLFEFDFLFFFVFNYFFFQLVFFIHSHSVSGLVFLFSQCKFYVRTCPDMFLTSSSRFFKTILLHNLFHPSFYYYLIMHFQLNFVRGVVFHS